MADKSFGIKKFDLIGSGTPKIESPNNINLNAVNVAISTNATVGGTLDVEGASGFGTHISLPDHAKIRLGNTPGDFDIHYDNDAYIKTGSRGLGIQVHNGTFSVSSGANNDFKFGLTLYGFTSAVDLVPTGSKNIGTNTIKWNDAHFSGTVNANTFSGSGASLTGIVNANISNSAAIAGTKISPDFGTQNVTTTGTLGSGNLTITGTQPALDFIDNGQDPDYKLYNNNGILKLLDTTNNIERLIIESISQFGSSNCKVGINTDFTGSGTYMPGNVLELFGGSGNVAGQLRIGANSGNSGNSTGIIQFFDNTHDNLHKDIANISAIKVPHNSTSTKRGCDLVFRTKVDQGDLTEKLRITDDGNVGIGTDFFPQLVVDSGNTAVLAVGIVTAHQVNADTFTGALTGNADTATQVKTQSTSTNANHYLTFVDSNNSSATNETVYTDGGLYFNPTTNALRTINLHVAGIRRGVDNADVQIESEGSGKFHISRDSVVQDLMPNSTGADPQYDIGKDPNLVSVGSSDFRNICGKNFISANGLSRFNTGISTFPVGASVYTSAVTMTGDNDHGGTQRNAALQIHNTSLINNWGIVIRSKSDPSLAMIFYDDDGDNCGRIQINNNSTDYVETSDYRIKENETLISDGITRLKQLKPYRFNFKKSPSITRDGFFAHEVQSVVPEAVTGTKDEVASDGYMMVQGIDKSKLIPLLTAALQEEVAKREALEARVAALEGS